MRAQVPVVILTRLFRRILGRRPLPRYYEEGELARHLPGARSSPSTRVSSTQSWKIRLPSDRITRTFQIRIRLKFCQNSGQLLRTLQTFRNFEEFSTSSRVFGEIPRKFHQNWCNFDKTDKTFSYSCSHFEKTFLFCKTFYQVLQKIW